MSDSCHRIVVGFKKRRSQGHFRETTCYIVIMSEREMFLQELILRTFLLCLRNEKYINWFQGAKNSISCFTTDINLVHKYLKTSE